MHRLSTLPGGWTPDTEGVVIVDQTPAPWVFLSAADTDIQAIAQALDMLPPSLPPLRACNLLHLCQPFTVDDYADKVLAHAQLIAVRLLGGKSYWPYGLEVLQSLTETQPDLALVIVPGEALPDPTILELSTVPLAIAHQFWRYLDQGGAENVGHALQALSDYRWGTAYHPPDPVPVPAVGRYPWKPSQALETRCLAL